MTRFFSLTFGLMLFTATVHAQSGKTQKKFDEMVQKNLGAGQIHYAGSMNCKRRDRVQGAPTTTISLPGARRSWIDGAEFTAHHVYTGSRHRLSRVYGRIRNRLEEAMPATHLVTDFDETSAQWDHKETSGDHVSVGIQQGDEDVTVSFYPPLNAALPMGNPCK